MRYAVFSVGTLTSTPNSAIFFAEGRCQDLQESTVAVSPAHIPQIDKLVHLYMNLVSHHHLLIPSHSLFRDIQLLADVLWRSLPGETRPDYSPEESTIFCGMHYYNTGMLDISYIKFPRRYVITKTLPNDVLKVSTWLDRRHIKILVKK